MIIINKGMLNKVALTLTEKSTLYPFTTYNLFVLKNESNSQQYVFTATDISNYKARFNLFNISENFLTEDALNGIISLSGNTSQWSYRIFESLTPYSANTLSISSTTGVVLERGRLILNGFEQNNTINQIYL